MLDADVDYTAGVEDLAAAKAEAASKRAGKWDSIAGKWDSIARVSLGDGGWEMASNGVFQNTSTILTSEPLKWLTGSLMAYGVYVCVCMDKLIVLYKRSVRTKS